ncbi:MAG TPA: hypothetical protein ENH85_06215 [Candidatus Scalindua sp.]|nr:hypothetical protein [Candidatus Scalindua sp.]
MNKQKVPKNLQATPSSQAGRKMALENSKFGPYDHSQTIIDDLIDQVVLDSDRIGFQKCWEAFEAIEYLYGVKI